MITIKSNPIKTDEINSLLGQVDLQNIFDEMTKAGKLSILVVVKPSFQGASTWQVYNRMTGEFLCIGNMLTCLSTIAADYGIRPPEAQCQ